METKTTELQFFCPNHGLLKKEDVVVWCNHCSREELIYKDGMYLCPSCFEPNQGNFSCMICNKKVRMITSKIKKFES
jgi:DNA-directed RNA polymerase subunit RPC12/RpoP